MILIFESLRVTSIIVMYYIESVTLTKKPKNHIYEWHSKNCKSFLSADGCDRSALC